MQIISGKARNLALNVPQGESVRPTSARSRKAMFDSLAVFQDKVIVDLFAGSGALGLEAASRGAAKVYFVEVNVANARIIEENINRVKRTGVETEFLVIKTDASVCGRYSGMAKNPDMIFADPPYGESGQFFRSLTADQQFIQWVNGALLIWEMPDFGDPDGSFLQAPGWNLRRRKYGSREFILAEVKQ
ncbi:MAG: RsmD family RNA methyltransferase [Victivallaceae bacterium]|jgi:16S rRNA (guanine966-N2)-methyltransferase